MCRLVLTTSLVLFVSADTVRADTLRPRWSYTETSPDGQHVFVMIAPEGERMVRPEPPDRRAIRDRYPTSGMYRNDGSRQPLWTVDEYWPEPLVVNGGVHVIRLGNDYPLGSFTITGKRLSWLSEWRILNSPALRFYANGTLTRSYDVRDVITNSGQLPHTYGSVLWLKDERLADDGRTYEVHAVDGTVSLFDVTTGDLIDQQRPPKEYGPTEVVGLVLAAAVVILTGLVVRRYRRWRKNRSGEPKPANVTNPPSV